MPAPIITRSAALAALAALAILSIRCANGTAETDVNAAAGGGGGGGGDDADGGIRATPSRDAAPASPAPGVSGPSIYVAPSGDDTATGASAREAVHSIPVAIHRAEACPGAPCAVVIAGGKYDQQVKLADGVSLLGGFSADFKSRDPKANVVTLTSTEDRVVIADGLTRPATIDGVTIVGADLTGTDGRSSTALYIAHTHDALTVTNSVVTGGHGASGAAGAPGGDVTCTASGGVGGESSDCGAAAGTPGNASGDPTTAGGGGAGGSSNCPSACPLINGDGISSGRDGESGGNGANGAAGAAATNLYGTFTAGVWSAAPGTSGARGVHGTGGGGGGAGGAKRFRACFGCDTLIGGRGGDGAAGGCAGDGGGAGGAGGASFGVVLVEASATLTQVTIDGGVGGEGADGGDGRAGQPGNPKVGAGRTDGKNQKCGLIHYDSGGGGTGGRGGNGGAGGGGAGGAGGLSVARKPVQRSTLAT